MAQSQCIYGDAGKKGILKKSVRFDKMLEERSGLSTSEVEACLTSWFLTPLDMSDPKFASFFYCPIGLKNPAPDLAAYGINGTHTYGRGSSYMQLYISDLDDLTKENFFGIFAAPYLSSEEVEEFIKSNREAGEYELKRYDLDTIDSRKTISDEALKAIFLLLYRGKRVYILSDSETNFFSRSRDVLQYIYSFLPTGIRRVTGCISGKPYSFTSGTDIHKNLRLLLMAGTENNRKTIKEQYIDLASQVFTLTPQADEVDFMDSVDKWIRIPFREREAIISNLQRFLKDTGARMDQISSYTSLFRLADRSSRWWESSDKKYSLSELKDKYNGDYVVQNHPEFREQFRRNIPHLLDGRSLDLMLEDRLRNAQSIGTLVDLDDDLLFFMDNFGYPNLDEAAVKRAAMRIYGSTHAAVEWKHLAEVNSTARREDMKIKTSKTAKKVFDIYRTIDKRYDEDWEAQAADSLYSRWNGMTSRSALLEELLDIYEKDRVTVTVWPETKAHISDADIEAYLSEVANSSRSNWEIWNRLKTVLGFAQELGFTVSSTGIQEAAKILIDEALFVPAEKGEKLLSPISSASGYLKVLYDFCTEAAERDRLARLRDSEALSSAIAENEKLLADKAETENVLSNAQSTLTEMRGELDRRNEKLDAAKAENEMLRADKAQNETELASARSALTEMQSEVNRRNEALTAMRNEVERRNEALTAMQSEFDRCNGALSAAKAENEKLRTNKAQLETALTNTQSTLTKTRGDLDASGQQYKQLNEEAKKLSIQNETLKKKLAAAENMRGSLENDLPFERVEQEYRQPRLINNGANKKRGLDDLLKWIGLGLLVVIALISIILLLRAFNVIQVSAKPSSEGTPIPENTVSVEVSSIPESIVPAEVSPTPESTVSAEVSQTQSLNLSPSPSPNPS